MDEGKFPSKLYVTHQGEGEDAFLATDENLETIDAKDGDKVAVYRLAYVRPIRIKRNLALSADKS